ncbi:MAG: hypothetical protein Q9O62_13265 [Ardenticatenia bacterium]|nr:hypothetical protein [Ardenticatenia bacterium]
MTRNRISLLLAVLLLLVAVTAVSGQAYTTSFITSITYQNVGTADANVTFNFYNEASGTAIPYSVTLPANAGSSLYVGNVSGISSGFQGSAVMSSDQPLVATLVQIPQSTTVKNRPLSNGFSAGASQVLIATVLKNTFNTNTKFSVQNVDTTNVDITVEFYPTGSSTPITVTETNIPPGAAKYFDTGALSQLGTSFNGSAIVKAVQSGTTTPANIVASALELQTTNVGARAFEGVTGGATTVYMPTALCDFYGTTTYYAIQNIDNTNTANVTVTYSNGNTDTKSIGPGQKASFNTCDSNSSGFSGAATITSTGAEIVAIGKVGGAGRYTAFLGETGGASRLALPYVRWTSDTNYNAGTRQRAFIAIQNIGTSTVNNVQVSYMNKNGEVVGIHTISSIAPGAKANSKAIDATLQAGHSQTELDEFGTPDANPGGGYGGSVIIEGPSGSQLVAVVRISSKVGSSVVAEDYNGIPLP